MIFNSYISKNIKDKYTNKNIQVIAISALYISSVIYDSYIVSIRELNNITNKNSNLSNNDIINQIKQIIVVEKSQFIFDLVMNLIEHEDINIITKKNKIEKKDKNFYYLFLLLNLNLNINYNKYINNIHVQTPRIITNNMVQTDSIRSINRSNRVLQPDNIRTIL